MTDTLPIGPSLEPGSSAKRYRQSEQEASAAEETEYACGPAHPAPAMSLSNSCSPGSVQVPGVCATQETASYGHPGYLGRGRPLQRHKLLPALPGSFCC